MGFSSRALLAVRAKPSSAPADFCRSELASAARTFSALVPVRQKPRPRHEIGVGFRRTRFLQNVARGPVEFCEGFVVQAGNFRRRMHAGAEKNFVRLNVPYARN